MAYNTGFDKVAIANMALSLVGARSTIASITENSPEAEQIRIWYDFSRVQTLQSFNWAFARKRKDLVLASDAAPEGIWTFRYNMSTDMIEVRSLKNPLGSKADAIPYDTELDSQDRRTIVTDLEDAEAVYTADIENALLFTPLFVEALASALAAHIAFPLTGDMNIQNKMEQRFNVLLMKASGADTNEKVDPAPRDAEWIRLRN